MRSLGYEEVPRSVNAGAKEIAPPTEERSKMELDDYSGEVKTDLKLEDLSKDALIRLVKVAGKNVVGQDGIWHTLVKEKYGFDAAAELLKEVWTKDHSMGIVHDMRRLLPAFKIEGNDIAAMIKYLQLTPAVGIMTWEHEIEILNKNHAIFTVTYCPSIIRFEKLGDEKTAKLVCVDIDVPWLQAVANQFNPRIKTRPLSPLPRKCSSDVPCKWELKLEE